MKHVPATTEDALVLQASSPHGYMRHAAAMQRGDAIDARAMLAREVDGEFMWRASGVKVKPADIVRSFGDEHRAYVETQREEPLL
jgi:hypothetical protein